MPFITTTAPTAPLLASTASLYTAHAMALLEHTGLITKGESVDQVLSADNAHRLLGTILPGELVPPELSAPARYYFLMSPEKARRRLKAMMRHGRHEWRDPPQSWAEAAQLESRIVAMSGDPADHPLDAIAAARRVWRDMVVKDDEKFVPPKGMAAIARGMAELGAQSRAQALFQEMIIGLSFLKDRNRAIHYFRTVVVALTALEPAPWVQELLTEMATRAAHIYARPHIAKGVIAENLQRAGHYPLAAHYYKDAAEEIHRWRIHDNEGEAMIMLSERFLNFDGDDWFVGVRKVSLPMLDALTDPELRYRGLKRIAVSMCEWRLSSHEAVDLMTDLLSRTEKLDSQWHRYEIYDQLQRAMLFHEEEDKAYALVRLLEAQISPEDLNGVMPTGEIIGRYEAFRYPAYRAAGAPYLTALFPLIDIPYERVQLASALGRLGVDDRALSLFGKLIKEVGYIPAAEMTDPTADCPSYRCWLRFDPRTSTYLRINAILGIADGLAKAQLGFKSALLFRRLHILTNEIPDAKAGDRARNALAAAERHAGLSR